MRILSIGMGDECDDLRRFSKWLASTGDGILGGSNDECVDIDIHYDIILKSQGDLIVTIESTYPIFNSSGDDLSYLKDNAILAPTIDVVESVNKYVTSVNSYKRRSIDTPCKSVDVIDSVGRRELVVVVELGWLLAVPSNEHDASNTLNVNEHNIYV
ncbi:helicase-like protein [Striga asiatica]|uniref:Helicase-like protein n=1 Tax=Striga asiatica TaxID=4170 RepID=A0A5A7PM33_STRAF|nr:helicase-like protein [Striga asiatica]